MKNLPLLLLLLLIIFTQFSPFSNIAEAKKKFYGQVNNERQKLLYSNKLSSLKKNSKLRLRLLNIINTNSSQENDEFYAEIVDDLSSKEGLIIPSGSIAHGKILKLTPAKTLNRDGQIKLFFDFLITPDGRKIPIEGLMSSGSKILNIPQSIIKNTTYALAGASAGSLLSMTLFGLEGSIISAGSVIATGATIGGITGLNVALSNKGRDITLTPKNIIEVKTNSPEKLAVYKESAPIQFELKNDNLDIKINNIKYKKNPYNKVDTIVLDIIVSNKMKKPIELYDIAITNRKGKTFFPAIFSNNGAPFKEVAPNKTLSTSLPFCVENIKTELWLTIFNKDRKIISKISLNNAYRSLPEKTKIENQKILH